MSKTWTYRSGDWSVICDRCSKKIKASKAKHEWTGLIVCPNCFEHRHPQDFIKVRQDKITVPFQRPRPADVFTVVPYQGDTLTCSPTGMTGIAGFGVAGCAVSGKQLNGVL